MTDDPAFHHPLAGAIDKIEPNARYTADDLALLLGLHRMSVVTLAQAGYLPGEKVSNRTGGGRHYEWAGQAIIEAVGTEPPPLDDEAHHKYSLATLWRWGCGCDDCRAWHYESTRQRRRDQIEKKFPEQTRREVLAAVADGTQVADAAAKVGVSAHQVWGYTRVDEVFAAALDEAGEVLCVDATDSKCGTPGGHRWLKCRGTACRIAKRGGAS